MNDSSIHLEEAATSCSRAMVDDEGTYFYPDGPEDAQWFMEEHGARFVDPDFKWDVQR